jgi:hypothetical protein
LGVYTSSTKQINLEFNEAQIGQDDNQLRKSKTLKVDGKRGDPDRFDHSLRHETGHAVDRQTGIMAAHASEEAFGGWKEYKGKPVMTDMVRDAGEAALFSEAYAKATKPEEGAAEGTGIGKRMQEAVTQRTAWKTIKEDILGEAAATALEDSKVKKIIEANEDGRHWTKPAPAVDGHIYGYQPNAAGWLRYSADAREKRGLSAHQFMAPSEWFAEAYAFYFDEKDTKDEYGGLVNDKDPKTKSWLDKNIAESE